MSKMTLFIGAILMVSIGLLIREPALCAGGLMLMWIGLATKGKFNL